MIVERDREKERVKFGDVVHKWASVFSQKWSTSRVFEETKTLRMLQTCHLPVCLMKSSNYLLDLKCLKILTNLS
jgi:hypothetical protein